MPSVRESEKRFGEIDHNLTDFRSLFLPFVLFSSRFGSLVKAFNGLVDEIGGVSDDNQFLPLSYLSQVVDEFHIRGRQSSLLLSRVKVGASLQPGHGLCIRQDDFVRWLSVPIIAPPPTLAGNEDVSPPPDTVSQLPQDPWPQSARALEQYFSLLGPTDSETPPAALAGHSTHQATATLARLTASALAARAVVDAAAEKVGRLTFAFVAPLGSDDHDCWHGILPHSFGPSSG